MMRKRFLSLTCALALCLSLLPVTALAAEGAPGSLYVAGQQITDEGYYTQSGGNWTKSDDPSTPPSAPYFHYTKGNDNTPATLTLSGATIQGGTSTGTVPYGAGIYAQCSNGQSVTLTIKLIGENTITGYYGIYVNAEISADSYGTDASLTITGESNGSLKVSGSYHGIYVKSGTGGASLNINDASVVASSSPSNFDYAGVYVQSSAHATSSPQLSLAVNGGSLTASGTGSSDGISFYVGSSNATGATTSLTVSENAIVDARNGGISALKISETLPTPTPTGNNSSGIVFDGTEGTVYGDVELQEDLEIGEGESLDIPSGASLTIPAGITLTVNGGELTGNIPTNGVVYKVTEVKLDKTSLILDVGGTATLAATVEPDNATNKNVNWESSDTSIATVDASGKVTAISAGSATITATAADGSGVSASCSVTVTHGNMVRTPKKDATCTADGNEEYWTCDTCGKHFSDAEGKTEIELFATVIPATGHTLTKTEAKAPTCTAEGNKEYWTCGTCGKIFSDAEDKTEIALKDTVIPATGHTFRGGWCAVCGARDPNYVPPANPNYRVDVTATEGGAVTKDPAAAKAGETVTLTPTPDAGYEVGTVTVTDRFGDAVAVTENADGTYTFTMPNGQVRVNVTFVEVTPEPLPFTDVAEGDWFHDAVQYVYDNGLMDGVGEGQFAPNATTNRAMVVTILYRLAGEPDVSGDVAFTDVESGLWYSNAVLWAAQNGIVNGISDTEFAPSGDLTREQLATVLYRYAESMGYDVSASADLSGFPDAGDIQSYATEALSWAVAEGLLQGFEDDSLQPGGTATRAQIATILMRFLAAAPTA